MPDPATAPSTPAAQAAAARLAAMKPPPRSEPAAAPAAAAGEATDRKGRKGKEKTEKKKQSPAKVVGAVALLAVVGFVAKGKLMKPHYGPGHPAPAGQVLALGSITTNLSDGHLAQVSVSLQLTKPASVQTITRDEPQLTSTLVTDLGRQTYAGLLAPAGRAALQAQLLGQFQQTLGTAEGAEQVTAVYFTGFVLQ